VAKGPEAFRTISEAAEELGVPQHVLRFWETKFSFIRPMKRAGGRRFYRPQDLLVLTGVRTLLYEDGYTIKGVQRLHKEQGLRRLIAAAEGGEGGEPGLGLEGPGFDEGAMDQASEVRTETAPHDAESEQRLREALDALEAAKARLARALGDG
jgi:DNA-binding transcriptional MerR regulator